MTVSFSSVSKSIFVFLILTCLLLTRVIVSENEGQNTGDADANTVEESVPLTVAEQVRAHIQEGDAAMKKMQYTTANKMYSAAIKLDKTDFTAYYKRAISRIQKKSAGGALQDLDKALALKPDYTQALVQRGNVLMSLGRLEEARAQFQDVIKAHPENTAAAKKLQTASKAANAYKSMVTSIKNKDVKVRGRTYSLSHFSKICRFGLRCNYNFYFFSERKFT